MDNAPTSLITGCRGAYQWLTTEHDLDSLLTLCPEAVMGKYIAVTSFDSGSLSLNDLEKSAGWESRNEIAYSPRIQSQELLPPRAGYDEWYVFGRPVDLGKMFRGNIFEALVHPGSVEPFVNYGAFCLHRPEAQDLVNLFWQQMEWIQPESYLADGHRYTTFVCNNTQIFAEVHQALKDAKPPQ